MKITQISITDYLGISVFKTDKLGKMNRIKGDNGVGKTSIEKAIREAFESSGVDMNLIRTGADKAEILIELDERILIQKTITPRSNTVDVTVDGAKLNKPQTWLNGIFGRFNFNPVEFFLAKPKERREILLSAIAFKLTPDTIRDCIGVQDGLIPLTEFDYDKHGLEVLEDVRKHVYDRRTEQNAEATRLKKAIEQDKLDLPKIDDAKRFDGFKLETELANLQTANDKIAENREQTERLTNLRQKRDKIKEQIAELEKTLADANIELAQVTAEGQQLVAVIGEYSAPDIGAIQSRISDFNAHQKTINALEDLRKRESECAASFAKHKALDTLYKRVETELPKLVLKDVKLPVSGLEIDGDVIRVNGVDIDKMSTKEQIVFAANLARELAGKLKVICIDRFESLSPKNREIFEQSIGSDDFEYFVTQVTEGPLTIESEDVKPASSGKKTAVKF